MLSQAEQLAHGVCEGVWLCPSGADRDVEANDGCDWTEFERTCCHYSVSNAV